MTRPGEVTFTDLYELTMAAGYQAAGLGSDQAQATFDLFVRRLPEPRNFLVAAGLADVLDHLEALRITGPDAPDKPAIVLNSCQHAREWADPNPDHEYEAHDERFD